MNIYCFETGSSGNCIRVEFNNGSVVYLDAGVPLKRITTSKANSYVLVTHEHGDHSSQANRWIIDYGGRIICSRGTASALNIKLGNWSSCVTFDRLSPKISYSVMKLTETKPNDIYVIGLNVQHDAVEPLAFCVFSGKESLFYCVDTSKIPDTSGFPFDAMILEANYTSNRLAENLNKDDTDAYISGRVQGAFGHVGLDDVEKYINSESYNTSKVFLAHISTRNFDVQELQNKPTQFRDRVCILQNNKEYIV